MIVTATDRDRETVRRACGVRVKPGHWANASVHSFLRWTGESSLLTWCGIEANTADGARLTTDLISCLQCAQNSLTATRG